MTSKYPVSPGQQRHWRYQRTHPGSAAFNMTIALRLSGVLETSCVRQALLWILNRHQALRVTFAERNGVLTQQVQPADAVFWRVADLSGAAPPERYVRLRELGAAEAARPFDLTGEPVTRLILARLNGAEHALIVNVHHIAFDGWSLAVLLDELAAAYPAAFAGQNDPVAPLSEQYTTFASRQQTALMSVQWQGQLNYWRNQLAPPPPALRWPDFQGGAAQPADNGDVCWGLLPSPLPTATAGVARALRATPYMVQLAAYLALLRTWTGCADLCVGVPLAARRSTSSERVLGFFVNTVALRANIAGNPLMTDIIGSVRRLMLDAHRHQDVPYGVVLDGLAGEARTVPPALFQTMFILQNEMRPVPAWGDIAVQQTMLATGCAKYDLTVSLESREQTLAIDAEYRPARINAEMAGRLLGSYVSLLQETAADPHRPAGALARAALNSPADVRPPARPGRSATEELFRGPVSDWRPGRGY